jgi:polysaccharide export outer membrane protein
MRLGFFIVHLQSWPRYRTCTLALVLCLWLPGRAQSVLPAPAEVAHAEVERTSAAVAASVRAATSGKVPEYTVGEADVLRISVWKDPELSQTRITVRPDGMISVPLVGVVKVSGLTPSQIQDLLAAKLSRFINKPQVTVTVAEIRSKSVYVTGEVGKPGEYALDAPTGVLQFIIKAGGLTSFARRKSVFILRNTEGKQQKIPVNVAKLLRGDAHEQNVELKVGDTVVVP